MGLLLGSLFTSLLTLAGAALIGESPADGEPTAPVCLAFPVGSSYPAHVHLHLENVGPQDNRVRLDFLNGFGQKSLWAVGYDQHIAPWTSIDVVLRSPALGALVEITSSSRHLRSRAEIRRDDGGPSETRTVVRCLTPHRP
jgi:hypothetical protein